MKWARRILFVALLVALPIGAYQFVSRNEQPIAIDYLAGRVEAIEIWEAVGVCFAAGFLLGWLFEATGNLVAPVTTHVFVNAVNLRLLSLRYAPPR